MFFDITSKINLRLGIFAERIDKIFPRMIQLLWGCHFGPEYKIILKPTI